MIEEIEFTAKVRLNGRVVIPKEEREKANIKEGDTVHCRVRVLIRGPD